MPQVMTVVAASPQFFYVFTLGMVAVFNPCGFPLLPAYLELFTAGPTGQRGGGAVWHRAGRAVYAGALATAGFMALFGLFGLVTELGWSAVYDHAVTVARYLMAVLGVAMVALALSWLLRRPLRLNLPSVPSGLGLRRPLAMAVFGLSYGVASLGCALPLFIGGVATTFTGAGPVRGIAVFATYGLGMGVVLGALALVVAVSGPAAARALRPVSRLVPTVGAIALALVGTYLAFYWSYAIFSPAASSPAEGAVTRVQNSVAGFVGGHSHLVTAIAGALVVGALVGAGVFGQRRAGAAEPTSASAAQPSAAQPSAAPRPEPDPLSPAR